MDHKKINIVLEILKKEFIKILQNPLKASTLNRIKNRLKGNMVLGMESSSRRMSRLAKNELYYGEYVSVDKLLDSIDQTTAEDVLQIAQKVIKPDDFINVIFHPST